MSLPSYLLNLDEFSKVIQSAVSSRVFFDPETVSTNLLDFQFQINKFDLWKNETLEFEESILIYGLEIIESSYGFNNYCELLGINKINNMVRKIIDIPIDQGSNYLIFDYPLFISEEEDLIVRYINNSGDTKKVNLTVRYLR